jgi:hypothetical protein
LHKNECGLFNVFMHNNERNVNKSKMYRLEFLSVRAKMEKKEVHPNKKQNL